MWFTLGRNITIFTVLISTIIIAGCIQEQPKTKVCPNSGIVVNISDECPMYWCGDNTCLLGTYRGYSENCSTCPQDCGSCSTTNLNQPNPSSVTNVINSCPTSCDDGNKCTFDSCSAQTNYQCVHQKIANCCGDNVCDSKEECEYCINDCYSFSTTTYTYDAKNAACSDSTLIAIRQPAITLYAPPQYKDKLIVVSNLQDETLKKIVNFIGKSPKIPLILRFTSTDVWDNFGAENTMKLPVRRIDDFYNLYSKGESMMEVHEVIHAINSNNCYDEHYSTKIPKWADEGTAFVFSFMIPIEAGNANDWQSAMIDKQSTTKIFVDGFDSGTWKPTNDPHDVGNVLFYIWSKYNVTSGQFVNFVNSLYSRCQNRNDFLNNREVIDTWNQATGRNDNQIFGKWGVEI